MLTSASGATRDSSVPIDEIADCSLIKRNSFPDLDIERPQSDYYFTAPKVNTLALRVRDLTIIVFVEVGCSPKPIPNEPGE
jgi:hypothetical protein